MYYNFILHNDYSFVIHNNNVMIVMYIQNIM